MRRIFISFRETDRQPRESFEGTLKNPTSPLKAIPISSREDKRGEGKQVVRNYIKNMLDNSDTMIVLIGDDSHNSEWIDYEMDVATSKNKPILGVRIPDTSGAGPTLFRNRGLTSVEWNMNIIKNELDKLLLEIRK